ncbi:MAG: hypothetical protein ABJA67_04250 [Chthonomonadales bacterium]
MKSRTHGVATIHQRVIHCIRAMGAKSSAQNMLLLTAGLLMIALRVHAQVETIRFPDPVTRVQHLTGGFAAITANSKVYAGWFINGEHKRIFQRTFPVNNGIVIGEMSDADLFKIFRTHPEMFKLKSIGGSLSAFHDDRFTIYKDDMRPGLIRLRFRPSQLAMAGEYFVAANPALEKTYVYKGRDLLYIANCLFGITRCTVSEVTGRLVQINYGPYPGDKSERSLYLQDQTGGNGVKLKTPSGKTPKLDPFDRSLSYVGPTTLVSFAMDECFSVAEYANVPTIDCTVDEKIKISEYPWYAVRAVVAIDTQTGVVRPILRLVKRNYARYSDIGEFKNNNLCQFADDGVAINLGDRVLVMKVKK